MSSAPCTGIDSRESEPSSEPTEINLTRRTFVQSVDVLAVGIAGKYHLRRLHAKLRKVPRIWCIYQ